MIFEGVSGRGEVMVLCLYVSVRNSGQYYQTVLEIRQWDSGVSKGKSVPKIPLAKVKDSRNVS